MRCGLIFIASGIILFSCSANRIKKAALLPMPSTPDEDRLLQVGVEYQMDGRHDEAITIFERVLEKNEHNVKAMYEIAFSYLISGQYERSLLISKKGLRYHSRLLPSFHITMGNAYSHLGESKRAQNIYRTGLKRYPEYPMLHFNLAVTQVFLKDSKGAEKSFQTSAELDPFHPDTHFYLGKLYFLTGRRIPSLLALSRFLMLEPRTERSSEAHALIQVLFNSMVVRSASNQYVIKLSGSEKNHDPLLSAMELSLAVRSVTEKLKVDSLKAQSKDSLYSPYQQFLNLISEAKDTKHSKTFAVKYYIPYFQKLFAQKFDDIYPRLATLASGEDRSMHWLLQHELHFNDFLEWDRNYPWPEK